MAVDILYDNGTPTGSPLIPGEFGPLLDYTIFDANSVSVTYEAGNVVVFTPSAGDVALLTNPNDNSDFCVIYVTGVGLSPAIGLYPVSFEGDYDNNVYTFSPATQTDVKIYSVDLYADLNEGIARTYRISAEIQKSHYSNLMIAYQKRISYEVTLDNLRRAFWGISKDSLYADTLFLIDSCQSPAKAYKVSSDSNTFELFNNKFKNTISFKIAV
jgi:hypothetical protein